MTDLEFMSAEHVSAMNALLAADGSVRAACAALAKPVTVAYELSDGPDGATVHWSVACAETLRFGLEPVAADLVLRGDWSRMVRASRANREGRAEDPGLVPAGDASIVEVITPLLSLASQVATLPVEFPQT